MPATTSLGIPYPVGTDNNNVPADIQSLATWLDPVVRATYTQAEINAFNSAQRWNGRRVYNTTRACYQWTDGTSWYDEQSLNITSQAASHTFTIADANNRLVRYTGSSSATFTVPTDASVAYPVGTVINIAQYGAGQLTIAGAGGVTVNFTPGNKTRAQYSVATIIKIAANEWLLTGDITA